MHSLSDKKGIGSENHDFNLKLNKKVHCLFKLSKRYVGKIIDIKIIDFLKKTHILGRSKME